MVKDKFGEEINVGDFVVTPAGNYLKFAKVISIDPNDEVLTVRRYRFNGDEVAPRNTEWQYPIRTIIIRKPPVHVVGAFLVAGL